MKPREQGFLLLTGLLGNPKRNPLTVAQFRTLANRVKSMSKPDDDRDLTESDLISLGYDSKFAQHILLLLSQQEQLHWYIQTGKRKGCTPISRINPSYPQSLRNKLGLDCPGSLWTKGDISLLEKPCISLVGSRDLMPENLAFAEELGRQAALQGYVLVSGNARGADRTAQDSCLKSGGSVISVVADTLEGYTPNSNILYLSENGYELPFSAQRAHSRNRVIHCLGEKVFVAQSNLHTGGTWAGTIHNLQNHWSPVFVFDDNSRSADAFYAMGAIPVSVEDLKDIEKLK